MSCSRVFFTGLLAALLLSSTWLYARATPGTESTALPQEIRVPRSASWTLNVPIVGEGTSPIAPLWRFGIANARRPIGSYTLDAIAPMRFGWFVDWGSGSDPIPDFGLEYVPMVRVKQVKVDRNGKPTSVACAGCAYANPPTYSTTPPLTQIPSLVASHPGRTWVVGNEIDRRDWGTAPCSNCSQDEITPELYAQVYHDVYTAIKGADPTVQVAIGGVIEATPLRLTYIQRIWDRYDQLYGGGQANTMPVDVWNVHAYVLPEIPNHWGAEIPAGLSDSVGTTYGGNDTARILANRDFSYVIGQIRNMRAWMQQHGQRNKPLYIVEYGISMPDDILPGQFTPDQVANSFMYPSFNYFLNATDADLGYPADGNRLVQRWNWYSLDDDGGSIESGVFYQNYNSNLFYSGLAPNPNPQGIAPLGNYWRQYVQGLPGGTAKPY